jgi:transcriptional regulator with XRE-family HTH domain
MLLLESLSIKDVKVNIADLVKILRKKRGLSQEELAEQLNLSRITISNLELGKNATLDTLFKVFQYLEVLDTFNAYVIEEIKNNEYNSLY